MKKSMILYLVPLMGLIVSGVSVIISVTAGVGTRFEVWDFRTGLSLISLSARIGIIGAIISLIGIVILLFVKNKKKGFTYGTLGLIIGLVFAGGPLNMRQMAKKVPPIHDITTDMVNPPQFVATLPLREKAINSTVYEGEYVAALQKNAYPDIKPLFLSIPADQVFEKALTVASKMDWSITAANREGNRIEAVATTFWMGFKDDIVIRISTNESGTRLDIRSESRVGRSDLGTNAQRVRKFLSEMQQ
jgi:uncharacterized protein (DUF1499 family)